MLGRLVVYLPQAHHLTFYSGKHQCPAQAIDPFSSTVKVIACIEDPAVVNRILNHLEHRTESNQILPQLARAPPSVATPDGS
jgi:hypothetical protein